MSRKGRNSRFNDIRIGRPINHGSMTVFPLFCEESRPVDYLLSDEAMVAGTVTVSEVSQQGSVPDLIVENKVSAGLCSSKARSFEGPNKTAS